MNPIARRLSRFVVAGILASICPITSAGILYVDTTATGDNTGTSWDHAFTQLRDALPAAQTGDQIWVAAGTYRPADPNGDRTLTFQLETGVALYGGFAGHETKLNERDWVTNETILSGDLNADDGPDFEHNEENSYHVVTGSGTDRSGVLDGFTITSGHADGDYPENLGGGLNNVGGSPTLANCIFRENSASSGAGVRNADQGHPGFTDCTFMGNVANYGGGLYTRDAPVTLEAIPEPV